MAVPSEVDVEKYAKVEKSIKSDDSQPTMWPAHDVKDDYVFECEGGNQYQKTKLTILQSLGDPLYYGKIQPWKADEESDSQMSPSHSSADDHSNWFIIGSKTDAERVVNQYQELVQNEAKCPVKMSHSSSGSASLNSGEEGEPETSSIQSSVLGKGVKHRPPPIKLPQAQEIVPQVTISQHSRPAASLNLQLLHRHHRSPAFLGSHLWISVKLACFLLLPCHLPAHPRDLELLSHLLLHQPLHRPHTLLMLRTQLLVPLQPPHLPKIQASPLSPLC